MRYDDEMLERALAALPLEETPPDLHARILAATIRRRPVPVMQPWELWIVGIALTLAVWLVLAISGSPIAGGAQVSAEIQGSFDRTLGLVALALQPSALLWIGIGVTAAVWFSQLTFPRRGGGEGIEA